MTAAREKTFLLARPEARVLEWIARRLPALGDARSPDALGVLAAVGIAAAYALSNQRPVWLWAASGLLVVHWLGDSLDGTLARVRRTERPRYGYYLDHLVDAVATALIGHRPRAVAAHAARDRPRDRRSPTWCCRSTRTWRRTRSACSRSATGGSGRPRRGSR